MSTLRQKLLVKKMAENVRKKKHSPLRKIMREVGYSDSYADSPKKILKRKSTQELLEEYLPEDLVMKTHKNLLQARQIDQYEFDGELTDKFITEKIEESWGCDLIKIVFIEAYGKHERTRKIAYYYSPNTKAQKDAVDMAHKIRGTYKAEKISIIDEFDTLTDEELVQREAEMEMELNKRVSQHKK